MPYNALSPMETLGVFLGALLAVPIIFGFALKTPRLVVTSFIVVLFCFSSSTWGQIDLENTVYTRGTGLLTFPLLALVLLVAGVATFVRKLANPHHPQLTIPLRGYLAAFVFLMLAHITLGLAAGVDLLDILHNNGLINILYMLLFLVMMVNAFRTESDQRKLLLTILALAAIRAVFGLVRYVLFDGDSANPYRNFERIDIKIFYFDIADNFVAALAAFCIAWLLTTPGVRISMGKKLFLYGLLALEIAAVALSLRRTSLIGMALMFLLLFVRLPWQRRILVTALGSLAVGVTAIVFFQNRLQFSTTAPNSGILGSLFYDVAPGKRVDESRWYELYAAAQSVGDNWLFGLGSWGTYTGDMSLLGYHFGKLDFVHSGLGHIALKSGLVGVLLFITLLGAFCFYYFRNRNRVRGNARLLADAGFAGFLFWIPTMLVGTPIIEFRTMLLIGMTLAMPFIAIGVEQYRVRAYAMA